MNYGCIGEKLGHSFSAEVHKALFDYSYELCELSREQLDSFMREKAFKAINVTIPYKELVIPYLDEIDEVARNIGAVNTVVNKDGHLAGFNTDFYGMKALVEKNGIEIKNKKVLVLGSGGTSKTASYLARYMGASSVISVSRSGKGECITYEEALKKHRDTDILINTTPCGMYPNTLSSAVNVADFPRLCGVVDAVYNPLRTKLICDAQMRGISAVGGLYMLVAQAAYAAELFVDKKVQKQTVDKIFYDIQKDKRNIVLIGMPGSGKSTVGKQLAELLGMDFKDSDEEFLKEYGSSPADMIKKEGEAAFREAEAKIIHRLSYCKHTVLATGGGSVLREDNRYNLKANGRVYFIDRELKQLTEAYKRPLSSNYEALKSRYEERYPIYCSVCDKHIYSDNIIENTVNLIKEDITNENIGN